MKPNKAVQPSEVAAPVRRLKGGRSRENGHVSPEMRDVAALEITVKRIGNEKNPVVVIDDFLSNPDEVRNFALGLQYVRGRRGRYYPGYTSEVALPGLSRIGEWLGQYFWSNVYDLPPLAETERKPRGRVQSFFAVYAPDPAARYVNVHTDGFSWLATLLHLSRLGDGRTGTAFWRHRPTGIESFFFVDMGNVLAIQKMEQLFGLAYFAKLRDAFLATDAVDLRAAMGSAFDPVPPRFPDRSHGDWELIDFVEAKYNRMVAYPTWQWHGLAYPRYVPPHRLRDARLTLNSFVECPGLAPAPRVPVADIEDIVE